MNWQSPTDAGAGWQASLEFRAATAGDVDDVVALVESAYRGHASRANPRTAAAVRNAIMPKLAKYWK